MRETGFVRGKFEETEGQLQQNPQWKVTLFGVTEVDDCRSWLRIMTETAEPE